MLTRSRVVVAAVVVLLLVYLLPRTILAQTSATMIVLRGEVAVVRGEGDAVQPAASGTLVYIGDEVRTLSQSGALITFFVGTRVELGEDTVVGIERISRQGERVDVSLKQIAGAAIYQVAPLTAGARYAVGTAGKQSEELLAVTGTGGGQTVASGPSIAGQPGPVTGPGSGAGAAPGSGPAAGPGSAPGQPALAGPGVAPAQPGQVTEPGQPGQTSPGGGGRPGAVAKGPPEVQKSEGQQGDKETAAAAKLAHTSKGNVFIVVCSATCGPHVTLVGTMLSPNTGYFVEVDDGRPVGEVNAFKIDRQASFWDNLAEGATIFEQQAQGDTRRVPAGQIPSGQSPEHENRRGRPAKEDDGKTTIGRSGVPSLSVNNSTAALGSNVVFTVTLSDPSAQTVSVHYMTSGGFGGPMCIGTGGPLYLTQQGTLQFQPGDTSEQISIVTCGDSAAGLPGTFTLTLDNPSGAVLSDAVGQGTIVGQGMIN